MRRAISSDDSNTQFYRLTFASNRYCTRRRVKVADRPFDISGCGRPSSINNPRQACLTRIYVMPTPLAYDGKRCSDDQNIADETPLDTGGYLYALATFVDIFSSAKVNKRTFQKTSTAPFLQPLLCRFRLRPTQSPPNATGLCPIVLSISPIASPPASGKFRIRPAPLGLAGNVQAAPGARPFPPRWPFQVCRVSRMRVSSVTLPSFGIALKKSTADEHSLYRSRSRSQ